MGETAMRCLITTKSVASQRTASETAGGRSDEADGKLNVTELKKLQNDIDRREISLQQAEEAIQARAALRTIEAEHAKTLQKKEAEFEERTRLQAKQAHEQLVKQQKAYEAQLAKERDRCESLRVELELQAKELDLQRHLAEENIMATSQKQQQELEDELRRLREQQRQTEMQLQRTVAEAAREASAMQSAAIQEKFSLSAAVQAAERKASEALKMVEKKEREMETLQEKLKQTQAERPAPPPSATPSPQAVEKKHRGPSYALKKFQTAARQVAVGQAFARLAKNKRMKTITPASSAVPPLTGNKSVPAAGKCQGLQVSAGDSAATPPTLSPRSYFRQMVPEKYTSLASAFRHMDVDHSGTVKLSEFANFVDDLGMNISFSVTHDLYKELAAPCDGMLVLSNFYKNLKGDSCTLTELHRRLEEIFGDVEQPFDDAGIPSDGRVTKEQFILIADEAGVSSTSATDLWNSMDRAHRGSLQRENVLLLLEDNVELDEVERVEQEAAAVLSNVLNVFSGSLKAPKPEAKVSRRSSFKKLTYTAAHRQLGFTPAEAQADDVLANSPPWDCIYPEDRKAMVSDMKARTVGKGRLIQAEEDPNCPLFIITQGTVDIFQPGFIQYSLIQQLTAPCLLYSENVLGGTPSEACAKAGSDEDVSLYELDRSIFERSYKRLLVQREREVADYQALLRKVPVVNKLSPLSLRCIASSFRKRTFHPDEEIIAKGDDADHVLMVKDGEAVAVGLKSSHEEVEVRVYRPLDFFGDGNIVKGRVHTASVRARTKCTILSIESEVFYNILQKLETEFRRRSGRSSTVEAGYLQKQNIGTGGPSEEELGPRDSSVTTEERSEDEKLSVTSEMSQPGEIDMPVAATPRKETLVDSELIERLLQEEATRMREECGLLLEAIPVLKDLPKERRQELCNRVTLEIYSPHQAIVLQGEAADKFYIVESGTVSIEIYIGCGQEMATSSAVYSAHVQFTPRMWEVYALKASDFEELLGDSYEAFSEHANRMYSQKTTQQATAADTSSRITEAETPEVLHLLSGVPVIKLLTLDQLKELVRAFQVINVGEREVVMHEGDTADKFYILLEGMVSVQKSPEPGKPRKEVAVVNSGEYLGEIAFLNNQPRTASCVAKTKVKLLYLGRDEFNKYLGHLSEAFLQHAESMYSTHQADMPSWLLDASSRSGSGPSSPAGDEALDAKPTSVNEGGKSTHKEKKTKKKPSEEALLSDATAGELEGVDSKKKKKKSKEKDKDKTASKAHTAATAPIAREDLDRLRDLLAGTFKNKYGSLAHAFAAMDVNNSDIVDADVIWHPAFYRHENEDHLRFRLALFVIATRYVLVSYSCWSFKSSCFGCVFLQEFYAFIKKSNVRGFQKPELDAIFDELCRPIKGRLIVGNLYRNARGVEPTGAEIHLRAIEIYGSALAAFKKVANIDAGDLCLRDNFTSLAAAVGVDKDKAESIWSQYIEGIKSRDDRVTLSTLIGLMSGELTMEEAEAKEASIRSIGNRIWAFFGGRTGAEDALSGSERPTSSDAVEETIQFEDPAVVQRDDHRAFPNETQLLLESIKHNSQLQVLSPQQQRYVASLMRREVVAATTSVAEGAEPALMWCSSGEFEVTQAGFFGVSVVRTMKAGDFFGVEELIAGEKLKFALTPCPSASECVLWILDKELFLDSVKDMLGKREAFVPVAQAFLHMVPLVRDLPEEQIAAVAKACKAERFAEGQTVFKMGFHGDMLCFIYSGEAITQKPQDDGGLLELARQGRGEYFGEMALIRNTRRTASVVAGTELLLLCLDKDSFETLLAPLKEKMAAKAASSYKRQDDAPPTESEPSGADGSSAPSLPSSRAAGEACVKKRTRKSSLALLNYSKIRDQEKQAEDGQGDCNEEKPPARWRLAQEPEVIHEPPPSTAVGGRSCLKGKDTQSRGRTRKSPVRFDEGSLLPSEPSSEED